MKIARLVGGFHEDATSGLNPNIYFVSGWQARQGHDVHVFALRKGKPEVKQVNGFILHYVGKPPLFRLFGGMALLQAVKESGFKPEVVHGLQLVPFGWLFPLARQKVNAKYVLSLHTSLNEGRHGFLRGWKAWLNAWEYGVLARFLARQVDLVLPIADFIVEEVRAGGVSADRVQVVRTGVDFKRFNEGRQPAREKQGRKNFVLLYVGRAAQKKGLTYLVRAMALLKDKDLRLRLVGCMKTDDDFVPLIREIDRSGASYRIELVSEVPYAMLPEIYADADAFVLPSILEPTGKVCLEAMAAGIPVIATRQGGTREIITNNQTGLLVEPRNPEELAEAILQIHDDPGLARRLAANGVKAAKAFDWETIAKNYSKAFGGLL